jgi:hypothetical protein
VTLIVSFDLDSTLADTQHRRYLIKPDRAQMTAQDWVDYSQACVNDTDGPAAPMIQSVIAQQERDFWLELYPPRERSKMALDFIVVSRRDNSAREATEKWLSVRGWTPRRLIMLKDEFAGSDEREHAQWKLNAIRAYEAETGDRVILHVDDWHHVTQHLLSAGVSAITIRGDVEGEYADGKLTTVKHGA